MKKRIRAYSQAYFVWYYDEVLRHIINTQPRVKSFDPKTNITKYH